MLAFMAMPTIVSISEDAITAVPWQYKGRAGARRDTMADDVQDNSPRCDARDTCRGDAWDGRVIGETMAVMMITGNAAHIRQHCLLR